MNAVFEVSLPVFGIGLFGYCAARFGYFSRDHADGLANFIYNFAVPLLLFRTLAHADSPTVFGDTFVWRLILAYYLPMAAFYAAGMFIGRALFRCDFDTQVITGFSFCYGNAILLGLPLALLTFGAERAIPFFILLAFHALSAFTVTTIALEYGRSKKLSCGAMLANIGKRIAANPIILGIVAGITVNQFGWTLPAPVDTLAGFMQNAVTPCALFALGATLSGYHIAGQVRHASAIVFAKCLVFPLVVWASCRFVFDIEPAAAMVATLLAAQPVGVSVFIFAARYDTVTARATATTAIFLSTSFTLLTIPPLLYFIDLQGLR